MDVSSKIAARQLMARQLMVRDDAYPVFTPVQANLILTLLVLVVTSTCLAGSLWLITSYRRRQQRGMGLPSYATSQGPLHRGQVMITTASGGIDGTSILVNEKKALGQNNYNSSPSSVPQIHITFPEEVDEFGKRRSPRVVVVAISDKGGVGLEPYHADPVPPYQQHRQGDGFKSLDLDRIGGLKEMGHERQAA